MHTWWVLPLLLDATLSCNAQDQVITSLAVIVGEHTACPQGYYKVEQGAKSTGGLNGDLNQGAGGKFIYLCAQKTTVRAGVTPITGLEVSATWNDCQDNWPRIWQVDPSNGDFNEGAGGKSIYICYTIDSSLTPLGDVTLAENDCDAGMYRIDQIGGSDGDFNQGAGGKFIYVCRSDASTHGTPMSNPLAYWYESASNNADISVDLTTGMRWQQAKTCSQSDQIGLSYSLELSGEFLGLGAKETLSANIMHSWGTDVSQSSTTTTTKGCTATCHLSDLPSSSPGWTLWQWRYKGTSSSQDLTTYTCNYLCIPQPQQPRCAHDCCTDRYCQVCDASCNANRARAAVAHNQTERPTRNFTNRERHSAALLPSPRR